MQFDATFTEVGQERLSSKARAILAAIEHRHEQALGPETYATFKTALPDSSAVLRPSGGG